ncbi:unnamed protein product [Cylicostephanus goldi]|uniref:Uncharacterized protein n=1 Tax=Cylicostephanus goldi TaxID=71465 RepID=A0A3P6T9T9_CYLGO|nr:unnamed protein product [Cylicostephanus goldi]
MLTRVVPVVCRTAVVRSSLRLLSAQATDDFALHEFGEKYLGHRKAAFTEKLEIIDPDKAPAMPIYRVTDTKGNLLDSSQDPNFDKVCLHILKGSGSAKWAFLRLWWCLVVEFPSTP